MSPKAVLIALLAMSGSFFTILAVMGALLGSDAGPPAARRPVERTTPALAPPASPGLRTPRGVGPAGDDLPDIPAAPPPLSAQAVPDSEPAPAAEPEADMERMRQQASRRLEGVEAALNRQVEALKQSRDQMLGEFAAQLADLPADEAATLVAPLDDETVALTLHRVGFARRQAILRRLDADRRAGLERRLRQLDSR